MVAGTKAPQPSLLMLELSREIVAPAPGATLNGDVAIDDEPNNLDAGELPIAPPNVTPASASPNDSTSAAFCTLPISAESPPLKHASDGTIINVF